MFWDAKLEYNVVPILSAGMQVTSPIAETDCSSVSVSVAPTTDSNLIHSVNNITLGGSFALDSSKKFTSVCTKCNSCPGPPVSFKMSLKPLEFDQSTPSSLLTEKPLTFNYTDQMTYAQVT